MDLPESWSRVEITEVLEATNNGKPFQQGWSPRCESFPAPEGKWGVLKTTSIQHGEFWDHENKFLPDHLEPRPHLEVKLGDVLMTCAGPRVRCGVACLVEQARSKLMMSGKMYRFRPHPEAMHSKYLSYMIQTAEIQREIDQMKTGINDSGLNLTHSRFAALKVVVAPLNEQRRIVAKIEELFSELDKGVESLKTARAQLNVYRQAVLKHAFEGKLTAQWREENKAKLETPEQLLARIKQEREARYERQLQEWKAAVKEWEESGKPGKKPSTPKKVKTLPPLTEAELLELPELPEVWEWGLLGNTVLDAVLGKMLDRQKNKGQLKPYLRNINVRWGEFDFSKILEMRFEESEKNRFNLVDGDLVICEGGEPGRCAIWKEQVEDMRFQKALHRVRLPSNLISNNYVYYFLLYSAGNGHLEKFFTGTTIKHLTGEGLQNIQIPVTSFLEQQQIEIEIEIRLSIVDQLENEIEENLQKTEAMRQSILKKAFSGQLVAQNPNDEPASVLLDRIKAEKAARSQNNTRAKRRRTTATA